MKKIAIHYMGRAGADSYEIHIEAEDSYDAKHLLAEVLKSECLKPTPIDLPVVEEIEPPPVPAYEPKIEKDDIPF